MNLISVDIRAPSGLLWWRLMARKSPVAFQPIAVALWLIIENDNFWINFERRGPLFIGVLWGYDSVAAFSTPTILSLFWCTYTVLCHWLVLLTSNYSVTIFLCFVSSFPFIIFEINDDDVVYDRTDFECFCQLIQCLFGSNSLALRQYSISFFHWYDWVQGIFYAVLIDWLLRVFV